MIKNTVFKVNIQRIRQPERTVSAHPELCQHTWHPNPAKIDKRERLGVEVEAL
jgi:hypothetical protein